MERTCTNWEVGIVGGIRNGKRKRKGKWEGGVVGGIRNGKWKEGKVG